MKKKFPLLLILFKIYQDLDHELIMNSVIGKYANIWSPEAKNSISSLVKIIDTRPGVDKVKHKVWFKYSLYVID